MCVYKNIYYADRYKDRQVALLEPQAEAACLEPVRGARGEQQEAVVVPVPGVLLQPVEQAVAPADAAEVSVHCKTRHLRHAAQARHCA